LIFLKCRSLCFCLCFLFFFLPLPYLLYHKLFYHRSRSCPLLCSLFLRHFRSRLFSFFLHTFTLRFRCFLHFFRRFFRRHYSRFICCKLLFCLLGSLIHPLFFSYSLPLFFPLFLKFISPPVRIFYVFFIAVKISP